MSEESKFTRTYFKGSESHRYIPSQNTISTTTISPMTSNQIFLTERSYVSPQPAQHVIRYSSTQRNLDTISESTERERAHHSKKAKYKEMMKTRNLNIVTEKMEDRYTKKRSLNSLKEGYNYHERKERFANLMTELGNITPAETERVKSSSDSTTGFARNPNPSEMRIRHKHKTMVFKKFTDIKSRFLKAVPAPKAKSSAEQDFLKIVSQDIKKSVNVNSNKHSFKSVFGDNHAKPSLKSCTTKKE